jgi:ligand-binding sensor domain-containing protein/class 3 adenylate cyclase/predicted metal-dependent HD superfamily phosphohydrolase
MPFFSKIFLFLLFLSTINFTFGQSNYKFRNYTINDGLSQSSISSIVQDDIGSLWIGTQDGLNRFDGYGFQVFTSETNKGIESGYINCSFKATDGTLWFGTGNGLTSYNQKTEAFYTHHLQSNEALFVTSIAEDLKGNIWFSAPGFGLFKLDKVTKKISNLNSKLPSRNVKSIFIRDNSIFIGFDDHQILYSTDNLTTFVKIYSEKPVSTVGLIKVIPYSYNTYFFASKDGVSFYDANNNNLSEFKPVGFEGIGKVVVSDLYVEDQSKIFMSTQNKGLLTLTRNNTSWDVMQTEQDLFQKNALLINEINCITKDRNGVIWIGTQRGLGGFDPVRLGFLGVGASADASKGLTSLNVWCFEQDQNDGSIFMGTDNAVTKIDAKTGKFVHYFKQSDLKQIGEDNSILSLKNIAPNVYLVGSINGLFKLRINSNDQSKFTFENITFGKNQVSLDRTYCIAYWKDSRYWIGTRTGVYLYDVNKGLIALFEHNKSDKNETIGQGAVRVIYKDRNENMFFAPSSGGLFQLKVENNEYKFVPSIYHNTLLKCTKDYITSILEDENHIWFGSFGTGLLRLNLDTQKIKVFSKKQGMPNNVIYGILEDRNEYLWVSTNRGIAKFNTETEQFTSYSETNGLLSNEFNLGAAFEAKNGQLYFGSISGFNYFTPKTLEIKNRQLIVNFSKIKFDGDWLKPNTKGSPIIKSISNLSELTLHYKQRSFTLRFMTDEIYNPELVTYKYRLEGSEEGEIMLGNENEVRFASLEPGNYTLSVYAKYENGPWSRSPAKLTIYIQSPFWMRWWFWMLISGLGAILTIFYIRSRITNERREQVRLESKIAQRTKEIRAQAALIEDQNKLLEKTSIDLQLEKDKSEILLRNVLPESMAMELKNEVKTKARPFKEVSVMFTDFVGFSAKAENMTADELVGKLDFYFTEFDTIIERNNLEKIKTIGDAYMCAGGVPVRNKTHPMETVLAGLQIQSFMRNLKNEALISKTEFWELRLGINTGPISAGVIGSKRFAYDIWGKSVNHAQRMERMGDPGKVTISGETYEMIVPYFECTYRGKVQSKSKGYIDMYTVERLKIELSEDPEGQLPNERFFKIVNLHLYSSIQYTKAEMHIMRVLEDELAPELHYHSIGHTKDVTRSAERIALLEGVNDEELFLLKSAATYHDAGFVKQYDHNEPIGAAMAEEILPKYGYSDENIERIKELIYVTQIPHQPKNKLEEIICDADLDYLGRDDFFDIADKLRRELREHGKINSDRLWDQIQIKFLNQHQFFTETSIKTRQPKKLKNIEAIELRLEQNKYAD